MNTQPLATRGVGITIKPERNSFWASKAPLWLIAISLFTIACCLVLIVIRSTGGDTSTAQASAATNEVKAAEVRSSPMRSYRFLNSRREDETLVVHREPSKAITVDRKDTVTVDAAPAPLQPTLLAINTRAPSTRPTVLSSAQYQNGIKGTVRLKGEAPPETPFDIINVPCAEPDQMPRTTRFFVVDTNGGLADSLVFLSDGVNSQVFPTIDTPVELVCTNCLIEPYVSAMMSKQPLSIRDASGLTHGVNISISSGATLYDRELRRDGTNLLTQAMKLGMFERISCKVHPWEFAYVSVLPHPFFAITDEHGEFSITNIPPGKYTVEVRHRSGQGRGFEQAQKSVRLSSGSMATLDFEINAPSH
jgi:hypothetical protein